MLSCVRLFAVQFFLLLLAHVSHCSATLLSVPRHATTMVVDDASPRCASLENRGTHFTVDVEVGTPAQKFSVVADTGSNYLIIPSCICRKQGSCRKEDRCFQGTNRSSTFVMEHGPKGPMSMMITFGSGQVEAVVASDRVRVAQKSAFMKDGVLLMVDNALAVPGSFEGILGLGLPMNASLTEAARGDAGVHGMDDLIKKILGMRGEGGGSQGGSVGDGGNDDTIKIKNIAGGDNDSGIGRSQGGRGMDDMIKKIFGNGGEGSGVHAGSEGPGGDRDTTKIRKIVGGEQDGGHGGAEQWDQGMGEMIKKILGRGGLGAAGREGNSDVIKDIIDISGDGGAISANIPTVQSVMQYHPSASTDPLHKHKVRAKSTNPMPKSFLEYAGVSQFSMCFNDGAAGVLRLGSLAAPRKLGSIGQMHWGLGLQGVSVGKSKVPVLAEFCSEGNMSKGQTTPCAAIPDSGTTVIMAPKAHLEVLLDGICDGWARCSQNYTALTRATKAAKKAVVGEYNIDPFGFESPSKASVLNYLLQDCNSWMDKKVGIDELPPLHFDLTGAAGSRQTLKLPAWAYVLETMQEDAHYVYKHMEGLGDIPVGVNHTGHKEKVCSLAFGTMSFNTKQNGPVWILGTPLFYQFHVGYDLQSKPPSMSFVSTEQKPCGSCSNTTALLERAGDRHSAPSFEGRRRRRTSRQLRRVKGPLRIPNLDPSLPL